MKVCLDRLTYLQILSDINVYRDWQTDGNLNYTCDTKFSFVKYIL